MGPRSLGLCLVLAVAPAMLSLGGVARAELPTPPCESGWWSRTSEVPTTVTDLPLRPAVLIPVDWANQYELETLPGPFAEDLEEHRLRVEVRDIHGTLIAGTVSIETAGARPNDPIIPLWRATEDLVAGQRYTMNVEVGAAPTTAEYVGCPWQGFQSSLEFTVQLEPITASINVSKLVTRELRTPLRMGLCDNDEQTRCAAYSWICCPAHEDGRGLTATVDLPTPPPNGHLYYEVQVEFISPYLRGGGVEIRHGMHDEYPHEYGYLAVTILGPVKPDEECARATLWDRFDGTVIAVSEWRCALPEDHIAVVLDGFCDPQMCAMLAPNIPEPAPVEPGPETDVEPGPEASPEDIAEEVADPSLEAESDTHIAEADDAQGDEVEPADGGSGGGSGCGGGPTSTLFALVSLTFLVTRTRGLQRQVVSRFPTRRVARPRRRTMDQTVRPTLERSSGMTENNTWPVSQSGSRRSYQTSAGSWRR